MLKNWWLNRITSFKASNKLRHFCGVALLALLLWPTCSNAQKTAYTSGHDFITAHIVPGMTGQSPLNTPLQTTLYIVGVNEGCATVEIPNVHYNQTFWVDKDSVVSVLLPLSQDFFSDWIHGLDGISIRTTTPMLIIQATGIGNGGVLRSNNDPIDLVSASVVIPNQVLSQSPFRVPFGSGEGGLTYDCCSTQGIDYGNFGYKVVSAVDGGLIDFRSPASIGANQGPVWFGSSLDKREFLTFISGTVKYKNKRPSTFLQIKTLTHNWYKVMKLSGNLAVFQATIPEGRACEDMKLHTYADTTFYTPPISGNYGNQYSLMSLTDGTVITFNGQFGLVLDSLEILDTCIVGEMKIKATNPMLGYLAPCPDRNTNSNWSSPFSVSMSSTNELIKESLFKTFDEPDSLNHYILSVVTKTSAINDFLLDGSPVASSNFTPFTANPDWSWANIELETGIHKASSSSGFHAFHYTYYIHPDHPNEPAGFSFPSYGYTLGESTPYPQDSLSFNFGTEINDLKPFSDFINPTSLCLENTVFVQTGSQKNITWKYSFGDGTEEYQKIGRGKALVVSHQYTQPGSYWLSITDSLGCYPRDSILLQIEPSPKADFRYSTLPSCEGTLVKLESLSSADTYNWQWETGSSAEENPEFIYSGQMEDLEVTLVVTSKGCSDTLRESIDLSEQDAPLVMPNIFTPNGDGINDQYCTENIEGFEECFSLNIYNRWGTEVFATENPQDCWNGSNAASGVYFYVARIGDKTYKGSLTLMF